MLLGVSLSAAVTEEKVESTVRVALSLHSIHIADIRAPTIGIFFEIAFQNLACRREPAF